MVSRQWAAEQAVVPGLRREMSVCRLTLQEPIEPAVAVSVRCESAALTLSSRRSAPEPAMDTRGSRR